MRKYVETTMNGCVVSVETEGSHAATHLEEQPGLWELTREILRQIDINATRDNDAAFEKDLGRPVGVMDLVEVLPGEPRLWAVRKGRETFAPFVVRSERPVTNFVTMVLKHLDLGPIPAHVGSRLLDNRLLSLPPDTKHLDLFTTYIGRLTPPLPGDPRATAESLSYWLRYALVWGSQAIDETTVTNECPWPLNPRS